MVSKKSALFLSRQTSISYRDALAAELDVLLYQELHINKPTHDQLNPENEEKI